MDHGRNLEIDIEVLSRAVIERKLEAPAIFFLEMYKPMTTVLQHLVLVSVPLLAPLFGSYNVNRVLAVLEDRENIEALIQKIERKESAL